MRSISSRLSAASSRSSFSLRASRFSSFCSAAAFSFSTRTSFSVNASFSALSVLLSFCGKSRIPSFFPDTPPALVRVTLMLLLLTAVAAAA